MEAALSLGRPAKTRAGMSVTVSLPPSRFLRLLPAGLLLLLVLALLPGCEVDNSYSESIRYPVRTDPIWKEAPMGERVDPDLPGQLPLLRFDQLKIITELTPENTLERLSAKVVDPTKISAEDRETLQDALEEIFGTPAHPDLNLPGPQVKALRQLLRVGKASVEESLARGARFYRVQCQMCHGLTGDGRGPTAAWINPHPRDYRLGKFKFQSVDQTVDKGYGTLRKPAKADLLRTLRNGIEGTAMPAFNIYAEEELEAVAGYVILLSLRGETETYVFTQGMEEKGNRLVRKRGVNIRKLVKDVVKNRAELWVKSQGDLIQAAPYSVSSDQDMVASIKRGHKLFIGEEAKCASCHIDYGRQVSFKFDDWGTMVRPANLTTGVYRGGRRPIDLYWRIHSGINGSGMNAFGGTATGEQIWDLVNFVRALPYPAMLKKAGIDIH
jgi:mono/diheme cytochrome c family protein